jgi:hypothetical protein
VAPKNPASDKEAFFASLAIYDRPEHELHQRVLDEDCDVDGFIERAFSKSVGKNGTIPPL